MYRLVISFFFLLTFMVIHSGPNSGGQRSRIAPSGYFLKDGNTMFDDLFFEILVLFYNQNLKQVKKKMFKHFEALIPQQMGAA